MEAKLEVVSDGQFSLSVWSHNAATGFRPPSATVVLSAELQDRCCLYTEVSIYAIFQQNGSKYHHHPRTTQMKKNYIVT